MSLANTAENAIALLIFNNTNFANVGDATGLRGSTAAGNFYLSLHTANPGETGDQSTSEATYTGYARLPVARTAGGFTITVSTVSNTALAAFNACTGGSNTITHFGIGTDSTGAGTLLLSDVISSPPGGLVVSNGITPQFAAGQLTVSFD